MAFKAGEVWINEAGTVVAVKTVHGGFEYYVTEKAMLSNIRQSFLGDIPAVSQEIKNAMAEMLEAKSNG